MKVVFLTMRPNNTTGLRRMPVGVIAKSTKNPTQFAFEIRESVFEWQIFFSISHGDAFEAVALKISLS